MKTGVKAIVMVGISLAVFRVYTTLCEIGYQLDLIEEYTGAWELRSRMKKNWF